MKKARILHLITRAAIGGSQDNTFCTCERHDRDRFEIHLACNPDGAWLDRARRAADFFHPVPSLVTPIRPFQDARALVEIIRILRRGRYDLVHTHTAKAGILGRIAARLCRVPVVVHTYHAFPWHDFMPAWRRGLYVLIERGCRPLTDFALTVSENERMEGLRRGVLRPDCSQTVYSGIDFSKLDAPVDVAGVRAGLGVPVGAPVVLMAGRLDPQKAPTLMVEAFVQVRRRHPGAVLWLAGDGELRPQVEASIRQHG
ncbi:MAG TPA: glycosyltransferase, partial [Methylomirabilota bacterium]|nr:glycosyltransferase [Methylomirabilota bacterium]